MTLRTLLLSDLVDSTRLVERLGDTRGADLLSGFDRIARKLLREHGGREIDRTDGFLLLFDRPIDAVRYALGFHRELAQLSREEALELKARVGIHLGEVVVRQNSEEDVRLGAKPFEVDGLAKPTAARIMSMARGGQTLLTHAAFDLARRAAVGEGSGEVLRWEAHGAYLLKGVEEELEVFEVAEGTSPRLGPPPDTEKCRRVDDRVVTGWRAAPGLEVPRRSNWVIERQLGVGGFGEVWLATNKNSGDTRVFKFCLDALRLGALKREIALFRLLKGELGERPDIARILDWNFDEAPYWIESDYSAGGDLESWAASRGGIAQVPMAERLELFAQVADALAAAHSVGVLHKDVKPTNILISLDRGKPRAQLTDFGVGALTDPARAAASGLTSLSERVDDHYQQGAGTRLYMAPELLEGKTASVQADIYALGVVLYQLTVGDLRRALAPDWRESVGDPLLAEDIALAVQGTPEKRLRDAASLAERVRLLESRRADRAKKAAEAVAAARARKVRRIAMVAGVGLALLALATFFHARRVGLEAERANREAESARKVADFLVGLFDASDPFRVGKRGSRGSNATARELLDDGAARLQKDLEGQPEIQARLFEVIGNVYRSMGLFKEGEPLLEQSLKLRESTNEPLEVAKSLDALGNLYYRQVRYDQAEPLLRRSLELRRAELGPDHLLVAETLNLLANVQMRQGKNQDAAESYLRAFEIRQAAPDADPVTVAGSMHNVATIKKVLGDWAGSEQFFQQAIAKHESLQPINPYIVLPLVGLADLYTDFDRFAEAEKLLRRALAIEEASLPADHPYLASCLFELAQNVSQLDRLAEAEGFLERSLAIRTKAFGPDNLNTIDVEVALAELYRKRGEFERSERLITRAIALRAQVLGAEHSLTVTTYGSLAELRRDQGRFEEAETFFLRTIASIEKGNPEHYALVDTLTEFAELRRLQGRDDELRQLEQRIADIRAKTRAQFTHG
jgi:serine/threonine protein kinase/class 3 adenylate cyclase